MITKRDIYFLGLAEKQAISAPGAGSAYLGAVLSIRSRLFSFGANQSKTHPLQAEFSKNPESIALHAEIDAIKNALRQITREELRLSKTTLYIVRVKRINEAGLPLIKALSMPCRGCMEAILKFEINRVVYTIDEKRLGIID